ncbi:hypothetical protein MKW98_007582 [Papaver atlanticum]|uniref:Uncharacterized protein n=1 Tax=Papaver atlanticum TaxID=357466 RepID=A0AAD4XH39_9MAGN|nr:hypothetical protein MKW98_007582 [Papaver atlanticum]
MQLGNINPKAKVPFNSKEHPIGDPSVQLASCLWVLVRRNIPLTFKDLRVVPHQAKVNIWKIVEQRFIVSEHFQDYYFSKMGAYLKEARSRKAGLVLEALDQLRGEEREKRLAKLMPTSMSVNEWETFVKRIDSAKFRVNSKCNKFAHTISRQGYARLEEQMQKVLNTTEQIDRADLWKEGHQQHEGRDPNPCVLEAFALGEDKGVRLKGMGFGMTRKKIAANTHYKLIIKECQESCRAMNDRLVMLEEKNSKCACHEVNSHRDSPVARNNPQASVTRYVLANGRASTTPTTSPVSRSNEVLVPERFTPCRLPSWYKDGEVVDDTKISETDPLQEIHGMPIGFGAYTVCVITALVEGAHVYKPTSEFKFVGDAVGSILSHGPRIEFCSHRVFF